MNHVGPVQKEKIPWKSVGIGEAFPNFEDYYHWDMFENYEVVSPHAKFLKYTEVLTSPYKVWQDMVSGMPFNKREFERLIDKLISFHKTFGDKFRDHIDRIGIKDLGVFDKLTYDEVTEIYIPGLGDFLKGTYGSMSQVSYHVSSEHTIEYLKDICLLPVDEIVYDSGDKGVKELFNGNDGVIVAKSGNEIKVRKWYGF